MKERRVEDIDTCTECGSKLYLDSVRAELVCKQCGLVAADALVIPGTEREMDEQNRYALEADDSTILPQLYYGSRDAMGRPVGQDMVWILRRTSQTYNLRSGERSEVTMETRIRRLASQRGLPPSIALRAIYFYRQTRKRSVPIVKKPGLHLWALALLYAACRDSRWVITLEDVVGDPDNERAISGVWRYFKAIKRGLRLPLAPFTAENFITYFSGKPMLDGIGQPVITRALHIARGYNNPNSTPDCVAAGALYKALSESGIYVSQKDFCSRLNVSEISLRTYIGKLGGIRHNKTVMPDVSTDELVETLDEALPESDGVGSDREEESYDEGDEPTTPQEPEGEDDGTNDDERRPEHREALKPVRKHREVAPYPIGSANARKPRAKTKRDTADGGHTPVNRHTIRRSTRAIRQRSKAVKRLRR